MKAQSCRDFEVIVVDNSGQQAVRTKGPFAPGVRIIENERNAGFGRAINQGWRESGAQWIAALNDDAQAHPEWLSALLEAAGKDPEIGMVASQVRLGERELDSAGMLISGDGSSRQRGHGRPPEEFSREEDVLLPSGSAVLYRADMLEDTGGFAEDFFLYCEDTDLGLRARWRGWRCVYAPRAVVDHAYSRSSGRASALKALLVERNRLYLVVRNFPAKMLWRAPFITLLRYFWHVAYLLHGKGKAAEFTTSGGRGSSLPLLVLRAHVEAFSRLPRLLTERRAIRRRAYLTSMQFERLLSRHSISPEQVAAL